MLWKIEGPIRGAGNETQPHKCNKAFQFNLRKQPSSFYQGIFSYTKYLYTNDATGM